MHNYSKISWWKNILLHRLHQLFWGGVRPGTCQCNTTKPPKQCQEQEGKRCKQGLDEKCGEGGVCIPDHE